MSYKGNILLLNDCDHPWFRSIGKKMHSHSINNNMIVYNKTFMDMSSIYLIFQILIKKDNKKIKLV